MATDNLNAFLKSGVTIEALQTTKNSCGWLLEIAERSDHPDAEAAARWLECLGERSYLMLVSMATKVSAATSDPLAELTASAK